MAQLCDLRNRVTVSIEMFDLFARDEDRSTLNSPLVALASHGVRGIASLRLSNPANRPHGKITAKLSLRGTALVRSFQTPGYSIGEHERESERLQYTFLDLVDVSRVRFPSEDDDDDDSDDEDQQVIPFHFHLPKSVSHTIESSKKQGSPNREGISIQCPLPSSLSADSTQSSSAFSGIQHILAKITYVVRAQVYNRRGRVIGFTEVPIQIYNDTEVQPPICLSDFPSEYRCTLQKSLTKYHRRTGTEVSVHTAEPVPVIFTENDHPASTILPMTIEFSRSSYSNDGQVPKQKTDGIRAVLTWRLKSLTFLSTTALTSIPIVTPTLNTSSPHSLVTSNGQRHLLEWMLSPSISTSTSTLMPKRWTQTVNLPILLSKQSLLPPTTFSPFLSRRYHLYLELKLSSKVYGDASLVLEVPIQLSYRQDRLFSFDDSRDAILPPEYTSEGNTASESRNLNVELPIYCP